MLLRHSASYLLARGIPGLLNFAALAIYTRLLTPDEFGRYALILAATGLVDVVIFQWLRLVLARFIPANTKTPEAVQEPILAIFICLAAAVCTVGTGISLFVSDPIWRQLIAVAIPLTIAQSWLELNLMLASAQLSPNRFGQLLGSKSLVALALGGWFAWLGIGTQAPLLGLLAGAVTASTVFGIAAWRGMIPRWPERSSITQYLKYGTPLAATSALGWAISSSDRILIGWILGGSAAGVYAVGYDLPQYCIGMILAIINLATYPITVHKFENQGEHSASLQLKLNGELIFTVAMGGAVCLSILAPFLVHILVGTEFKDGAVAVMPWITATAAAAGIKTYYFDVAFHLARQLRGLIVSNILGAIINLSLNFILIPWFGLQGAAISALASIALATFVSAHLGSRIFPMPPICPLLLKGLIVSAAALCGTWLAAQYQANDLVIVVIGGTSGSLFVFMAAFALNLFDLRKAILLSITRSLNQPSR